MRILVISNYYPPLEIGGWEQLTFDVVGGLRQRGHEVYALTSNYRSGEIRTPEPHVERVLHLESPDPIHYHPSYILRRRKWERENQQRLAQVSQEFQPHIVFVNGMWNLPISLAHAAEVLCPGRVVYYMASLWPTEEDAHTAYWTAPANRLWLRLGKWAVGTIVHKLLLDGRRRNQLAFERVLCVSEFIRNYLVKEANIPRDHTAVVHNGVELTHFPLRDLDQECTTVRVLYAGRLSPDKGVHTAIEALGLCMRQQDDLPVTMSIVGSGPHSYEQRLRSLVEQFQLQGKVEFRGQVPRDSMPDILGQHDILVLPSIWQEPLARITQEAMACGLAVVGTETGGTLEILHNGRNGVTFRAGDAHDLADRIRALATDRALRIRLAQAARQTVEEQFSFADMVNALENHFHQMLKRDRSSHHLAQCVEE